MRYRTYKRDWTPTGETSDTPQYPGQMPMRDEGDLYDQNPPRITGWHIAGCIVASLVIYALIVAALVLYNGR